MSYGSFLSNVRLASCFRLLSLLKKKSFDEAMLAKQFSKQLDRAILGMQSMAGRTKVSTVHKSNMLIDEANAHFKATN